MTLWARGVVAWVCMVSAVGCQCGDMVPTVDPLSIIVEPSTVAVEVGSTAPLRARRVNGEDVTDRVTWHSGDDTRAQVVGGVVTGRSVGRVTVQATLDAFAAQADVDVAAAAPLPSCTDGVKNGAETSTDCGGPTCPRCVAGEPCTAAADCDALVCLSGLCQASTCFDGVQNGGETGIDCGGPSCGGCAPGTQCTTGADCSSGVCEGGTCAADSCHDGVRNGNETGPDCGGGGCPGCSTGERCNSDVDCASQVCVGGVCEAPTCTDHRQNGDESAPDCGGSQCAPCTPGLGCTRDADCQSSVCRDEVCQQPTCSDGAVNGVETAVDCGGPTCSPCDTGAACTQGTDCQSHICTNGLCQGSTCSDGVRNGFETGLDCGGAACPLCANGGGCASGANCQSMVCSAGQCVPPTCADGIRNGRETALDCGGPDCAPCGTAMGCVTASDCASGVCASGSCQAPTCTDGVRNGGETATDCGGGTCAGCSLGVTCTLNADCASGHCEAGVCAPPFVVSLIITPGTSTVPVGRTQALVANELMSDGTFRDVTATARWFTTDVSVATVSTSGVVRGVREGTAEVRASASVFTSNVATVLVTAAALDRIDVSPAGVRLPIGLLQSFTATGTLSDGSVVDLTSTASWSSSAPGVATVSTGGRATAVAAGTASITATFDGLSGQVPLTVTPVTISALAVAPPSLTLPAGVRAALTATVLLSDGTARDVTPQATWTSGDASIATFPAGAPLDGLVTALAAGSTTLTASLGGFSGSCALTVVSATLQQVQVFPADESLPRGLEVPYAAIGLYSDGQAYDLTLSAAWRSTNPAVASVNDTFPTPGLVRTLSVGSTQLEASFTGVTGSTSLTVNGATLTGLSVTPALVTLPVDVPQQYTAMALFSDGTARDVTQLAAWQTSDLAVATISNAAGTRGLLTGTAPGQATVTASLGGQSATGQLTVTNETLVGLSLSPPSARVGLQGVVSYALTALYSGGTSLDVTELAGFSSSNPAVALVRNDPGARGLAIGLAPGAVTITARFRTASTTARLSVSSATLLDLYVSPAVVQVGLGIDVQFHASGVWTDGTTADLTRTATWTSSLSSVALVSNAAESKGLATTRGVGVTTIAATWAGQSDSTTLTVTNARVTALALTPATFTTGAGAQVQYQAVATFDDGTRFDVTSVAAWSSSNAGVVSISSAPGSIGLATAIQGGSVTITARLGTTLGTAQLTVSGAALVGVAVSPASGIVPIGYWRPYVATATYADGLSIDVTRLAAWSAGDPAVIAVGNGSAWGGRVTGLATGTSSVYARFGRVLGSATANVLALRLVDVTVTPDDPTVAMGTPLQLTATGTFTDGTTTVQLDITQQVGWKVAPKKNGTISNTDGTRGVVTMYNPSSFAMIIAQAWEPMSGHTVSGNTHVTAR